MNPKFSFALSLNTTTHSEYKNFLIVNIDRT